MPRIDKFVGWNVGSNDSIKASDQDHDTSINQAHATPNEVGVKHSSH